MKWILLIFVPWLQVEAQEQNFHQATVYYNEGNFEKALTAYQQMDAVSAALDYNTGNTLMRLNRFPEALAHYRRAQWLAPGDPDLQANLNRAAEQLGVAPPALPVTRILTGWWSPGTWQTVFLVLCWTTAVVGFLFTSLRTLRPFALWSLPPLVFLLLFAGFGTWASLPSHFTGEAVVHATEAVSRFEPLPDATEKSSVPEGTVVQILESTRNWHRIQTGDVTGWMAEEDLVRL